MKPAVIVVDMLEGNFRKDRDGTKEEEKIIVPLRNFLREVRKFSVPVIFACDSFLRNDFIFKGRMKPHAIRGTEETEVLRDLEPQPSDMIVEKRRFSGFYKTDLDQSLRTLKVDAVAVAGIQTHFCVLATAFDAFCNDFETIILEDLTASYKKQIHLNFLEPYRYSPLYPVFRVMKSDEFLEIIKT